MVEFGASYFLFNILCFVAYQMVKHQAICPGNRVQPSALEKDMVIYWTIPLNKKYTHKRRFFLLSISLNLDNKEKLKHRRNL